MSSKEDALEAALLARMVGSHLAGVDHLTTERSNNPANKINMQQFVNRIIGRPSAPQQFIDVNSVSQDMLKAYQGLNEQAMLLHPEPAYNPNIPVASVPQVSNSVEPVILNTVTAPEASTPRHKTENSTAINILTRSDVDSIRNSLKNIDKTLAGMLTFLKNNKSND